MNKIQKYNGTAISLHWLVAILIFTAFGLGLIMTDIPGFTPTKLKYYSWHKWLGITVFIFAVIRVLWRATHTPPALPAGMPKWQHTVSHITHMLLYALIFIVPLTGFLYSQSAGVPVVYLGIIPLPTLIEKNDALKEILKGAHENLNWLMAFLVLAHLGAALKHHFIDKDTVLRRMSPFGK